MKRTSLLSLLTLVLCLILALAKCTPQSPLATIAPESQATQEVPTAFPEVKPPPTSEPLKLTDGLGRMVTLPDPAKRIVSMAPSNTEILFAIGAGGRVVGRDTFSDYPVEALAIADIGGGFGELNTEAIVSLDPDLVLAAGITPPEQILALKNLGLEVFALPNPVEFEQLFNNLRITGILTGKEMALFYALANGIYGTVPFLMLFQVGFLYTGLLWLFQQFGGDAVVAVAQSKEA